MGELIAVILFLGILAALTLANIWGIWRSMKAGSPEGTEESDRRDRPAA